ncbi:MAG: hypothetical protein SGI88_05165 [Candidatus Hydrogenedentes bacterium]|nr:hypothetical protein [Candidatus Hydrogenedentota bacterium]
MTVNGNKARITPAAERIRHIEEYIETFRTGRALSAVPPLWNLRVLHDECKHAGQDDISEMCSQLESHVIQLQMSHGLMPESLMVELMGMTQCISQRVNRASGQSMREAVSLQSCSDKVEVLAET